MITGFGTVRNDMRGRPRFSCFDCGDNPQHRFTVFVLWFFQEHHFGVIKVPISEAGKVIDRLEQLDRVIGVINRAGRFKLGVDKP